MKFSGKKIRGFLNRCGTSHANKKQSSDSGSQAPDVIGKPSYFCPVKAMSDIARDSTEVKDSLSKILTKRWWLPQTAILGTYVDAD